VAAHHFHLVKPVCLADCSVRTHDVSWSSVWLIDYLCCKFLLVPLALMLSCVLSCDWPREMPHIGHGLRRLCSCLTRESAFLRSCVAHESQPMWPSFGNPSRTRKHTHSKACILNGFQGIMTLQKLQPSAGQLMTHTNLQQSNCHPTNFHFIFSCTQSSFLSIIRITASSSHHGLSGAKLHCCELPMECLVDC